MAVKVLFMGAEKVEQTGESANAPDEGRFAIVYAGLRWIAVVGAPQRMLVMLEGGNRGNGEIRG